MKKYFFLDDENIELYENVERVFHQPVKNGRPVIAPETQYEGGKVNIWNSPIFSEDGGILKLWYIGGDELLPLYAESEDGLNWRRPNLKLVEYKGSRDNNIIDIGFSSEPTSRRLTLALNPSEDVSDRRYCGLTPVEWGNLKPIFSADGLRWHLMEGHPGICSDDEYRLNCDFEKKLLIATVKLYGYYPLEERAFTVPEYGRAIGLSVSRDGLQWTKPEFIYHSDTEDRSAGIEILQKSFSDPDYRSPVYNQQEYYWTDIYNMPLFPYYGIYIGLPVMFQHSGYWIANENNANQDGLLWPALTWSSDLKDWKRPLKRQPFIPLSPIVDTNIYDNGSIHACPPIQMGEELWFYYTGSRCSHVKLSILQNAGIDYAYERQQNAIFLARLRLDGFASMRGGEKQGFLLTKPVIVDGDKLCINARAVNGEVLAEIRDAETGLVIDGFGMGEYHGAGNLSFPAGERRIRLAGPGTRCLGEKVENNAVAFTGDNVEAEILWRGGKDLTSLNGRNIRILFLLKNADIYSFSFTGGKKEK